MKTRTIEFVVKKKDVLGFLSQVNPVERNAARGSNPRLTEEEREKLKESLYGS